MSVFNSNFTLVVVERISICSSWLQHVVHYSNLIDAYVCYIYAVFPTPTYLPTSTPVVLVLFIFASILMMFFTAHIYVLYIYRLTGKSKIYGYYRAGRYLL